MNQPAHHTIVAVDMGYGHLRPAHALSELLHSPVLECDAAPLAREEEQRAWRRVRQFYEVTSRLTGMPWVGGAFRAVLESATAISHLYPLRDLSTPTAGVRYLEAHARAGLGSDLVAYLRDHDSTLITTFYSPASFADYHGYDKIFCVVTDSDINRVWAPFQPQTSRVRYLAPSHRAVLRLRAYGVREDHIFYTGYPLPHSLLGGEDLPSLRANLAARIVRLDPQRVFRRKNERELEQLGVSFPAHEERGAPHLAFAVGGAGAQANMARRFLPSLKSYLRAGTLRLTLVAGIRHEVAATFRDAVIEHGLGAHLGSTVTILHEKTFADYLRAFNAMLAHCDVLWTKPSEISFFAGLGLPLILSPPVGVHEHYNRRWVVEHGAGIAQREPSYVGDWLFELLQEGVLAAAAWAGLHSLPQRGLYRIRDVLMGAEHTSDVRAVAN